MRAVAQREMGLFTVPLAMPFYAFKSQMPCDESKENNSNEEYEFIEHDQLY